MRALLVLAAWAVSGVTMLAQGPAPAQQPPPDPPSGEALRNFDPALVELAWDNRRWQLVHQGEVLKDFGPREQEARVALGLIRELKLDAHGTVGSPRPVMEYWLAGGQAPQGQAPRGLRAMPLEPSRLRAEQLRGQWYVLDGPRPLFCFGEGADDARQAVAVLRKYQFDHVGVIGQNTASMYVFLRKPHDDAPALPADGGPRAGGRQMTGPRFSRLAKNADGTPKAEVKPAGGGLEQVVSPALPPVTAAAPAKDRAARPPFGHRPLQVPAQPSDRAVFDWRQAQLKQVNGEWCLQAGSLTLARFGTNFREAQMAQAALRHYRFTEQRRVGEPAINLYAATARSPRGLLLGLTAESFQPDQLAVRQVGQNYALVQGQRIVLSVGPRKDDAGKMLEVVKAGGFDRLCKIGEPEKEGMTFFVRSR